MLNSLVNDVELSKLMTIQICSKQQKWATENFEHENERSEMFEYYLILE